MKILAIVFLLFLTACSETTGEKYERLTAGKELSDWRATYVWRRVGAGVVLNAIPTLHIFGLVIDTIYVWVGIDDLVLGNGSIVARERNCKGLVDADDYHLFFAWDGGREQLVMSSIRKVYDSKKDALQVTDLAVDTIKPFLPIDPNDQTRTRPTSQLSKPKSVQLPKESLRSITPLARQLIEKKIAKKISTKIGVKIVAKIIGKAIAGFVPFFGPAVAGGVNYYIMNDIDKSSRQYFREKSRIICP